MQLMQGQTLMYVARILVLLTVLPIHEAAHAWASYKLGDPTAKQLGRLTLNPFKHLDLFGSLAILFFGIGWAKPVPVDPRYFEDKKKGMALSALAGPLSNLLVAFVVLFVSRILAYIPFANQEVFNVFQIIYIVLSYIAMINVVLGIFNLIPIPPFDGSRIMLLFLPERTYFKIMQYERYIMIALLAFLYLGVLSGPLSIIQSGVISLYTLIADGVIEFVIGLFSVGEIANI